MSGILIKGGRVLDPATNTDQIADILIEDAKIKAVYKEKKSAPETKGQEDVKVIDAKGCYIMPGFIDLHVHLRDPGLTHKEDIASGSRAAARGGYTTICAMPNTKPVIDSAEKVRYIELKAKDEAVVNVLQIGAVTVGQQGRQLADIEGMARAGSPAISEDGKSVMDTMLYRKAMKRAAECGISVFAHCEDPSLAGDGVIHESERARELHLAGICHATEDVITARDILLAEETGVHLHLCHVSTARSGEMVRVAKEMGYPITAEVCPHHFTLSVEDIPGDHPNYKMNPPLRDPSDVEALRQGLKDGIFDVIATDHAPHTMQEKGVSMWNAPFGIVGLETAASLTNSVLVKPGILTPLQMAEKMSYNAAKILKSEKGTLREGAAADVVIFDPDAEYTIDAAKFASKGRNTPFHGRKVTGRVEKTIVGGTIVYDREDEEKK